VSFGEASLLDAVSFGYLATLGGVSFGDQASLSGVRFGDRADLRGVTFGDEASLCGATFGERADLSEVEFGVEADLTRARFGDGADLSRATFGAEAKLVGSWFVGDVSCVGAVFRGQQRTLGPMYAGGTIDLHDVQFRGETRLEIDAAGLVLSRAAFAGPAEIRVLRARTEASETTFGGRATIAGLGDARRPLLVFPQDRVMTDHSGAPLREADATAATVLSLRRTDVSTLTIVGVGISEARFAGAQGLERMRLLDASFDEYKGRQRVAEERLLDDTGDGPTSDEQRLGHPRCTAAQVAEIYRSLRKGREDNADAPGGNDLYVGEQLMRRRALADESPRSVANLARRVLLGLWAWVGGYGVRPGNPLIALVALTAAGWALAANFGLGRVSSSDALVFALRSMLLLPNSHNVASSTSGDALQVALRVLGPLLIGLIVLGIRAQVKR